MNDSLKSRETIHMNTEMFNTAASYPFKRMRVGGIPFAVASLGSAATWLVDAAKASQAVSVRLTNAYCVALAQKDSSYGRVLRTHGVNFPDGTPVAVLMRLRDPNAGRVRGPSLFEISLEQLELARIPVFFLGSTTDVLDQLVVRLREHYPRLVISGTHSPPFAPVDDEYLDHCASQVPAHTGLVWVGLGTPKQDLVSTQLALRLSVPCIGVGAAFDFMAGTVREAPSWVSRIGAEWLFRLLTEPRRLWRRYLVGNIQFLTAVIKHGVRVENG